MSHLFVLLVLSILLIGCNSLKLLHSTNSRIADRMRYRNHMSLNSIHSDILVAVSTEVQKPDNYVYGSVSAPDWVLPVGAILVVLTAAIPFLLRPGEQALDQMRQDEEVTGNQFGKKKDL